MIWDANVAGSDLTHPDAPTLMTPANVGEAESQTCSYPSPVHFPNPVIYQVQSVIEGLTHSLLILPLRLMSHHAPAVTPFGKPMAQIHPHLLKRSLLPECVLFAFQEILIFCFSCVFCWHSFLRKGKKLDCIQLWASSPPQHSNIMSSISECSHFSK